MSSSTISPALRVVFTAYWQNASPSAEVFYMDSSDRNFGLHRIKHLETDAAALLQGHSGNTLVGVVYVGHSTIELSHVDIQDIDWRFIQSI